GLTGGVRRPVPGCPGSLSSPPTRPGWPTDPSPRRPPRGRYPPGATACPAGSALGEANGILVDDRSPADLPTHPSCLWLCLAVLNGFLGCLRLSRQRLPKPMVPEAGLHTFSMQGPATLTWKHRLVPTPRSLCIPERMTR